MEIPPMRTMLYKKGGDFKINNLWPCETIVAEDDAEIAALKEEGWHSTPIEA
jgi:hypothetical protein